MHHLLSIPQLSLYFSRNTQESIAAATILFNLDPNAAIKMNIAVALFAGTVLSMGTERHLPFVEDSLSKKVYVNINSLCVQDIVKSCYALASKAA